MKVLFRVEKGCIGTVTLVNGFYGLIRRGDFLKDTLPRIEWFILF